jgi:alpha-galactosidase
MKNLTIILFGALLLSITPFTLSQIKSADGGKIKIEFNNKLYSRVISDLDGTNIAMGDFTPSEYIQINGKEITDFKGDEFKKQPYSDKIGEGVQYIINGISKDLQKKIVIVSYNNFPTMLFYNVTYTNNGKADLNIDGWTNNHYQISALLNKNIDQSFWSYQPGSYGWDNDWVKPLIKGFEQDNYLGMNYVDYGGGTPVVDIWREDNGVAVGHIELVPKLVSLPVSMKTDAAASLAVTYKKSFVLKPGESLSTFRTFVSVHHGDHFNSLLQFSEVMTKQGIEFKKAPAEAYESNWCGWGYEKEFTLDEFCGTFPEVKKLGIDWVVLDYAWYDGTGDFFLSKTRFPGGDRDMRKLVDSIHAMGFKAKIWWIPLAVDSISVLFSTHPEYMIQNEDGSPIYMSSFFKSFFLCPSDKGVIEISKNFVSKALKEWGFDGLKIDGNNLNCVPECYNPEHHHPYPEESFEQLPAFFKAVYETALSINPKAVIEICPCGTNQSFYILPYMNQNVASDPHNSWHVRLKGKTLRALTQSMDAYYGDHVELSDDKSDFASQVGIGAVVGTKFVWPVGVHENKETGDINLTPDKEKWWSKWIAIYKNNMLSTGIYRGELYDIGFDRPEAHAIEKGNIMYYSFYAPDYDGNVELKGLENKSYKVTDYVNNIDLGTISGPVGNLKVKFNKYLLIKVEPI